MITIVSGLPRSGTSLMMQMLHLGGAPVLADGLREADANNPKGYLEFEKVKALQKDDSWLPDAEGKTVKIISHLLFELPTDREYKVVFMLRPVSEVRSSQESMLKRLGRQGAPVSPAQLEKVFAKHLEDVKSWLAKHPMFQVHYVQYHDILANPRAESEKISAFLGGTLDVDKMVTAVDASLYRERKGG